MLEIRQVMYLIAEILSVFEHERSIGTGFRLGELIQDPFPRTG